MYWRNVTIKPQIERKNPDGSSMGVSTIKNPRLESGDFDFIETLLASPKQFP